MWTEHGSLLGDERNVNRSFIRKSEECDRLDILGTDVRIILKCALNKVESHGPNLPG